MEWRRKPDDGSESTREKKWKARKQDTSAPRLNESSGAPFLSPAERLSGWGSAHPNCLPGAKSKRPVPGIIRDEWKLCSILPGLRSPSPFLRCGWPLRALAGKIRCCLRSASNSSPLPCSPSSCCPSFPSPTICRPRPLSQNPSTSIAALTASPRRINWPNPSPWPWPNLSLPCPRFRTPLSRPFLLAMGPRARCAVIFEPSLPARLRAHDLRLTLFASYIRQTRSPFTAMTGLAT